MKLYFTQRNGQNPDFMINEYDYIFLKYINTLYENPILEKLIKRYEKGLSLVKRRQIRKYIDSVEPIQKYKEMLFMYILFKRTRKNTYIDELQKELYKEFDGTTKKELGRWYFDLKLLLDELNLPRIEPTKQVIRNINYYLE